MPPPCRSHLRVYRGRKGDNPTRPRVFTAAEGYKDSTNFQAAHRPSRRPEYSPCIRVETEGEANAFGRPSRNVGGRRTADRVLGIKSNDDCGQTVEPWGGPCRRR